MAALVEARSLPDWPGITGYQITSRFRDDVQIAIDGIMDRVGQIGGEAVFENPERGFHDGMKRWRAHGYVREPENPTRAACARVQAYMNGKQGAR